MARFRLWAKQNVNGRIHTGWLTPDGELSDNESDGGPGIEMKDLGAVIESLEVDERSPLLEVRVVRVVETKWIYATARFRCICFQAPVSDVEMKLRQEALRHFNNCFLRTSFRADQITVRDATPDEVSLHRIDS